MSLIMLAGGLVAISQGDFFLLSNPLCLLLHQVDHIRSHSTRECSVEGFRICRGRLCCSSKLLSAVLGAQAFPPLPLTPPVAGLLKSVMASCAVIF